MKLDLQRKLELVNCQAERKGQRLMKLTMRLKGMVTVETLTTMH